MRAGKLRDRVTIERPGAGVSDGMGGTTGGEPVVIAAVWASVEGLGAKERDQAKAVESERTHRVTIRHRGDVDETCRVRWGSRVLRVTGASDKDGRRRELELACVELGAEAGD